MSTVAIHPLHAKAQITLAQYFAGEAGELAMKKLVESCTRPADASDVARAAWPACQSRSTDLATAQCEALAAIRYGITTPHTVMLFACRLTPAACMLLDDHPDLFRRAPMTELYWLSQRFESRANRMKKIQTSAAQRAAVLCAAGVFDEKESASVSMMLWHLFNTGYMIYTRIDFGVLELGSYDLLHEAIRFICEVNFTDAHMIVARFAPRLSWLTDEPQPATQTLAKVVAQCRNQGRSDLDILNAVAAALQK